MTAIAFRESVEKLGIRVCWLKRREATFALVFADSVAATGNGERITLQFL